MATWSRCTVYGTNPPRNVYFNLDQVVEVERSGEDHTRVHLADGHGTSVVEMPEEVMRTMELVVAGNVPQSGVAAGNAWTAAHGASNGVYSVIFTSPFAAPPTVTVSLVDPLSSDNVICVRNVTKAGFDVVSRDIDPSAADGTTAQDSAFNFIAVGTR